MKESEKKDKYLDLAWELKKTVEHESDGYTNYNWYSWYSHQRIGIGSGGLGNKRMSGDVGLFVGKGSLLCWPSINCQQIVMDFPISRLANERRLKWKQKIIQLDPTMPRINNGKLIDYRLNAALLLRMSILYHSTRKKMASQIPTGYGPRAEKLFFDGDESKYELWEVKFLGYLRIQYLHQTVLSPKDQSDIDFVEKNTTVFTEFIQYLNNKSLSLGIRDARDNGKKAFTILREHYL